MRSWWQIFVPWIFWVLILGLVARCLDLTPEEAPEEDVMYLETWHCSCPRFKLGKYDCTSGTLNCSSCHHTARESYWFNAYYNRTVELLRGIKESVIPDTVLWWLGLNSDSKLRRVWKKLLTVIPRPLGSRFDLYCRTCVVMGSSQILWGSGHGINQHTKVFGMNQAAVQDFETDVGNQTIGPFNYPKNAGDLGAWSWLGLLLLKLSNPPWTSDTLNFRRFQVPSGVEDHKGKNIDHLFSELQSHSVSVHHVQCLSSLEEDTVFGRELEKQGKPPHYWKTARQTNGSGARLSTPSAEAGMEAVPRLQCEGKLDCLHVHRKP